MIFRQEALEHYAGSNDEGSVLRIDSFWSRFAFWFLLSTFWTAFALALCVPLHRYARGPAVIRASKRMEVTTTESGTVIALSVHSGQWVKEGQVLVELDSAVQQQELAKCEQDIEQQSLRLLRNLADPQARSLLPSLRAQQSLLRAQLARRSIRAQHAGQILDLHLRIGQRLSPGDVVVSLSSQDSFELLALLPGHARPAIQPGTPLRLELDGFHYLYLDSFVDSVSSEVIGPDAARRILGLQVADSLHIEGPVAVLRAQLHGTSFVYDDAHFRFFDGMRGRAELKTRTERALLVFVPGLREVFRHVFRRKLA